MSANSTSWPIGKSGNRSGYQKAKSDAAKVMARMIQERTRDGAALVEFVAAVFEYNSTNAGPFLASHGIAEVTLEDKKWAATWLSDRGFGRPLQSIDLTGEAAPWPAILLPASLTDAEIDAAEKALEVAAGGDDDG